MIKNMTKEELEILSYADLAELILDEENKTLNTPTIFRKICDLLEYNDSEYTDKIGDFYTALSTDKRFVFLKNNEWELREKHPVDIVMDDEDLDDTEEEIEEETEEIEEEVEETEDIDSDELDDELDDLSILSDDEIEEN